MNNKKEFLPSFIVGELKKNSKGNRYFFFSGLYCELFKSKEGKEFVRATILPPKENKETMSPDQIRENNWWND